ncbi:hypothetical protein HN51_036572 [Arachis hypogaea]
MLSRTTSLFPPVRTIETWASFFPGFGCLCFQVGLSTYMVSQSAAGLRQLHSRNHVKARPVKPLSTSNNICSSVDSFAGEGNHGQPSRQVSPSSLMVRMEQVRRERATNDGSMRSRRRLLSHAFVIMREQRKLINQKKTMSSEDCLGWAARDASGHLSPYKFNRSMFEINEVKGGSSYGARTYAGGDRSRQPTKLELEQALYCHHH